MSKFRSNVFAGISLQTSVHTHTEYVYYITYSSVIDSIVPFLFQKNNMYEANKLKAMQTSSAVRRSKTMRNDALLCETKI